VFIRGQVIFMTRMPTAYQSRANKKKKPRTKRGFD
jgi:hypothetical protein